MHTAVSRVPLYRVPSECKLSRYPYRDTRVSCEATSALFRRSSDRRTTVTVHGEPRKSPLWAAARVTRGPGTPGTRVAGIS
eukprot:3360933-Rhodomonas_salina.1